LSLSAQQLRKLNRIITLAQGLIEDNKRARMLGLNGDAHKTRIRRTGKELVQFRRMLRDERKRGVPVTELVRKYGISSAYIYGLI
jgi:hypothetical protein